MLGFRKNAANACAFKHENILLNARFEQYFSDFLQRYDLFVNKSLGFVYKIKNLWGQKTASFLMA